jgi:hypothetical protein
LDFWCAGLLGTCYFFLANFLWDKISDLSTSPLLSVYCDGLLIFNFPGLFDFGCCSLIHEVSFVDCYPPYFRQKLVTGLLLAFLTFQPLFAESLHGNQVLPPPPFSGELPALICF